MYILVLHVITGVRNSGYQTKDLRMEMATSLNNLEDEPECATIREGITQPF